MWLLIFLVWLVVSAGGTYWYLNGRPSPFSLESVRPPAPRELDQKKRDKVIKNGFSVDKVPQNLDAIVIGSGIGGLTTAATLAKAGKKVLVLEQGEVAGGLCHTIIEKGFEFDGGLHFVGQLHENSMLRLAFDQLSEGQLEFQEVDKHFDTIQIGLGEKKREYTIHSGRTEMEAHLKKQFPSDKAAIEKFFKIMKVCSKVHYLALLKLFPRWLCLFLLKTRIAHLFSPIYTLSGTSATSLLNTLTSNRDLHVILSYMFAGVAPKDSSIITNALYLHHFKRGAYYPKGGASEIPYHIIRTIQKHGGTCLVRAPVTQILVNEYNTAYGVRVRKGLSEEVVIRAPIVVSNCGLFTTFQKLIPPHVTDKPDVQKRLGIMKHCKGSLLVFCGFEGTQEELDLVSSNFFLLKNNQLDQMTEDYFALDKEEAPDNIPIMYITTPSVKDPEAKLRHPGKSCMTIKAIVNYEWFEEWTDISKRGDEYHNYKMRFANNLFDWACTVFPKIKDKLVFQEVACPLTNMHYMDHAELNLDHFQPEAVARNRCDTPVRNLYISGQDVFAGGIAGSLNGSLLCASAVLGSFVHRDLMFMKKELKRRKAKKE